MSKKQNTSHFDNMHIFYPENNHHQMTNIYFILSFYGDYPTFKDFVKIGISKNIKSRIETLKVGNPYNLTLWYSFKIEEHRSRYIEKQLHLKFIYARKRGEWFFAKKNIGLWIEEHKKHSNKKFQQKTILRKIDRSLKPKKEREKQKIDYKQFKKSFKKRKLKAKKRKMLGENIRALYEL